MYPENVFCLVSGRAWVELLLLVLDLATKLVTSSYTWDSLALLLLGGCVLACKLCTSSFVDFIM